MPGANHLTGRYPRGLAVLVLALATTAFVPPKRDAIAEIVGVYEAVGTHPDGSSYQGKGTIQRLAADRYEIIFDMPSGTFRALCLRLGNLLGCAWGSGREQTVAIWREAAGVTGVWADDRSLSVGRETSSVSTLDAFTGQGTTPEGLAYDAKMISTKYGAVQRVLWSRGTTEQWGFGLRTGALLIAGFPADRAGAAFYRISPDGTTLVGEWMDPMTPNAGLGTETMRR